MSKKTVNLQGISVPSKQNFLILDDEGDINELIVDLLEILGFDGVFYQAYSIADAKEMLSKHTINYILSDWNLPDGKGVSLLKAVRSSEKFKHLPFLMITGNSDVDSMLESSKLGVSEYLVKPFDKSSFQNKLVEGWKSHLDNEDHIIQSLKKEIVALEIEIEKLKEENHSLKQKLK